MKHTYQTGIDGELTAEQWLSRNHGMVCLERRFKCKAGEIDLIMNDSNTIVFIEVKTRLNAVPGNGALAVNHKKQARLANAARWYLIKKHLLNVPCRFDIVEISRGEVLYIPNAFQPGGLFYR